MISRRTLFARLTVVALAPLAKWLPKEECVGPISMPMTLPMSYHHTIAHYATGCGISFGGDVIFTEPNSVIIECNGIVVLSVPQEEA